ncbi:alpha/beta hydrolase [Paenibacillus spongiae]|uniref:Alpha/beta fold hydrolase n=1 Tax=Paenibacillus spongiae TaxID=2909671 RepID=A0ABY5SBB9_9BACL|nr:alpha/beta fold hydrolase [Paenibacillus spongiae]UVI30959.1 alpha/beta fold hydrolase [Paenibacillus spongiae]
MIPIRFQVEDETVRGTLHLPEPIEQPVPAVMIIPGFADTAVGPHNLHVQMAQAIVKQGFAVLRFDYRGQGESDGDFSRFTIKSGLEDAREGLAYLRRQQQVDANRLGIVGFSLGAMLAVQLASERNEVKALSLLGPVAYPEKVFTAFFEPHHFKEARDRGWIDWLGWPVGKGFLDSLRDLDPLQAMDTVDAKIIVFHGSKDTEVPTENGAAFANKGADMNWMEGADHPFSSVLQKKAIISRSCEWFLAYL